MLAVTDLQSLSQQVFKPLELLINFTLLLYLVVFYWTRRRELRVILLFVIGTIGVLSLFPFANPDENLVLHLNDVSEACCTTTFLIQITILGYDLNKKIKFKSILYATYVAESLIVVNIAFAIVSILATIRADLVGNVLAEKASNVVENVTLAFIFVFRMYCIAAASSWYDLLSTRRSEFICYVLFATHEVPFVVLNEVTGLSWEVLQSVYHRITIVMCLAATVHAKFRVSRSSSSRQTSALRGRSGTSVPRIATVSTVLVKRASNTGAVYVMNDGTRDSRARIEEHPQDVSKSTTVD